MKKIAYLLIGIFVFSYILSHSIGDKKVSAEDTLRQARELRLKARREHCAKIGEKMAACYAGDMKICSALTDSAAWFAAEYGETHEYACTTVEDPLTSGAVQE